MRKIICGLAVILTLSFAGCASNDVDYEIQDTSSMFVVIEEALSWRIVYHKETKVMYAVSAGNYNFGTFTLLVDEEGKPLLYD